MKKKLNNKDLKKVDGGSTRLVARSQATQNKPKTKSNTINAKFK